MPLIPANLPILRKGLQKYSFGLRFKRLAPFFASLTQVNARRWKIVAYISASTAHYYVTHLSLFAACIVTFTTAYLPYFFSP